MFMFLWKGNILTAMGSAAKTPVKTENTAARGLREQYGLPVSGMEDLPPVEFSYFSRDSGTPASKDNKIIKAIEAITNTKINFEFLVGDLNQKIGVMIASGDLPDMVFVGSETNAFINSGSFIPLENLITEYAPNLRAHYDTFWKRMKASDGHIYIADIYGTPTGDQIILENWGPGFWLQKDVLAEGGYVIPKTLDEYFGLIESYLSNHPTIDGLPTSGYEIMCDGWLAFCIKNPPLFLIGGANDGDVYCDPATGKAENRFQKEYSKPYYKKLNEEYHKGVIKAETLTQSYDQYLAKIASGTVLGMHDQMWIFNDAQSVLSKEGRYERTYVPLPITYSGVKDNYLDAPTFTGNNGVGVTINCKDPGRLMRYMDYLIREDVQRFLSWGIKGENWFYDDKGRMERPQDQREKQRDNTWRVDNLGTQLRNYMPKIQGSLSDGNQCDIGSQPEEYYAGLVDYDKEFFGKFGLMYQAAFLSPPAARGPYYPVWSMNIEDGSPARIAEQRVDDTNMKYLPRLVICDADEFDALWDEYQAALEDCSPQVWIDEVNRQVAERMAPAG